MGAKWEYRGCSQSSELKRLIGIHLEKAFRVGHSSQSVKPRLMGPSGQKNPELLNSRDLNGATQSGTGLKPFVFQWSHSCEARRASHVAGSRGNVINTGTLQRSHEKHTLGGPEYAEREKKNAIDPQGSKR